MQCQTDKDALAPLSPLFIDRMLAHWGPSPCTFSRLPSAWVQNTVPIPVGLATDTEWVNPLTIFISLLGVVYIIWVGSVGIQKKKSKVE